VVLAVVSGLASPALGKYSLGRTRGGVNGHGSAGAPYQDLNHRRSVPIQCKAVLMANAPHGRNDDSDQVGFSATPETPDRVKHA